MRDIIIYFDNSIDLLPVVIFRQNGIIRIERKFHRCRTLSGAITIGYMDAVESYRRFNTIPNFDQKRIETLFALTIGFSKGDAPKKWSFGKTEIIGRKLPKEFNSLIHKFENAKIGWGEFSHELLLVKSDLVAAVDRAYDELLQKYISDNPNRGQWIEIEHKVDSYFLSNQFFGLSVDRNKVEILLRQLNNQKYSALLYLEEYFNLDISGSYLSDEYLSGLVLSKFKETENTEELSDLLQIVNVDDKRIEAIYKVRECKIDYANLIKHYSLNEENNIFPEYKTIGSSSGRIFIAAPGTQYLKKSNRDIFVARDGYKLAYFDFRNYEPGIAAGLSNDPDFIAFYNTGDMYLKIATEEYSDKGFRKYVKITVLATLYGMSESSLDKYFIDTNCFDPKKTIQVLNSFTVFQRWKNKIIESALNENKITHEMYSRIFLEKNEWKIKTSALNHLIQSTGSKILKRCIFSLMSREDMKILIPMHDALLCEVKTENYEEKKDCIVAIMERIFREEVINITSRVVVGEFGG